jgi:3-oxoadipate enol-lactonase
MRIESRNIDGLRIAFLMRGQGIPLVLIHGYPLDHTIWDQVAPLLEEDFQLILPDLRGFGSSEALAADLSIQSHASDIAGLLDKLRLRRAVLAGHSMGGYVALAFARQFPRRTLGLGLISTQVAADTEEKRQARLVGAQALLERGMAPVAADMAPRLSKMPEVQAFVEALIMRQQPEGMASALHAMAARPDSSDVLSAATPPVVIVHGKDDELISIDRARDMKRARTDAELVELSGVGHMPMMEDPKAVAVALGSFRRVDPRTVKLVDS